jgi:hypothetical protein
MWLAPAPLHRVGVMTRWKTYYSAAMFDDQAQRYLSDCGLQERKSRKAFAPAHLVSWTRKRGMSDQLVRVYPQRFSRAHFERKQAIFCSEQGITEVRRSDPEQ